VKSISRRGLFKIGAVLAAAPSLAGSPGAAQAPGTNQDSGTLEAAARVSVSATHQIVLRGGTIITMDPVLGDFARGDLHIQGKHIVAVGRDLKVPAGTQVIDAAHRIIIPGFVDCHRHSWSAQFRRIIPDG
jgi:5-methylthioadenosine/S-adenosylhomocysteine deaminase